MFAGWDFGAADVADLAAAGYRKGVPMGAELPARPAGAAAPTFLVHAAKDALGANLDRIQVVKCWTARGICSRRCSTWPPPTAGRPTRAPATCRRSAPPSTSRPRPIATTSGRRSCPAAWADPEFDPTLACAYYARILEIPTPRWSTYDAVKHGLPIPTNAPAAVQQRAWTSPVWYTPSEQDRAERPTPDGMFTVAELADRGIRPMTDEEIRAVTVGRTVRSVNLVNGFEVAIHYGSDGNRSLMGLGDRPVVTPVRDSRDGRRIETSLLGDRMSIALFSVDDRILGARDDEAGFVNYEAFAMG